MSESPRLPVISRCRITVISENYSVRKAIRSRLDSPICHILFEFQDFSDMDDPRAVGLRTDLFILSLDLRSSSGIDTLIRARKLWPGKKLLVYIRDRDVKLALDCYVNGAIGVFIESLSMIDSLSAGVETALQGEMFIQDALRSHVDEEMIRKERLKHRLEARLTSSEYRILMLLSEGLSPDDIAREMVITPSSVATKISLIKKKLGITKQLFWKIMVDCYLFGPDSPFSD